MKTISSLFAIALFALPAMAAPGDKPANQLRPVAMPKLTGMQPAGTDALQCRGGPVEDINFTQYNATTSMLMVGFHKGSKAASAGLEPAQCAWKDRGMSTSEPTNLCQYVDHVFITVQHVHDSRYTPPDLWFMQTAWSKAAPWLEEIRSESKVLGFYVKKSPSFNCLSVEGRF